MKQRGAKKSLTTKRYIDGVRQNGWQRNYWEHIIRDEPELHHIREYIQHNPARWEQDQLHPDQGEFPCRTREPAPHYGHEAWMV